MPSTLASALRADALSRAYRPDVGSALPVPSEVEGRVDALIYKSWGKSMEDVVSIYAVATEDNVIKSAHKKALLMRRAFFFFIPVRN